MLVTENTWSLRLHLYCVQQPCQKAPARYAEQLTVLLQPHSLFTGSWHSWELTGARALLVPGQALTTYMLLPTRLHGLPGHVQVTKADLAQICTSG